MWATSYKKAHMSDAITIPVSEIQLTEAVHIAGNPHYTCVGKSSDDCCLIVRRKHGGYALVSGWADYQECLMQGYSTVKAIVVNMKRGDFMRQYGDTYLPLSEIYVPEHFAKSTPRDWKIQRVKDRLGAKKKLDKPITINKDHYIVDGYTRYLVAREIGMQYVPVMWINC
jgi:hypothetical protein